MAQITWDAVGEHLYSTGVDHGVLYLYDSQTKKFISLRSIKTMVVFNAKMAARKLRLF